MQRRDAIRSLAGLSALAAFPPAATWARFDEPKSPDDMPLPELMKAVGPMMASIPVEAKPLAPGLSLITGPGGTSPPSTALTG